MKLDMDALLKSMLTAAEKELKAKWPKARDYAGMEFQKILLEAQHIGELKDANTITEQEATYLMDIQRNATRVVLLTIEGLGIIAVEAAINAALGAVRDAINAALGSWKIL